MREFILFTRGWTKPFSLDSLPNAGRMDLIARCISNAIFISEAIRPNVRIHVVLNGPPNPPLTITFDTRSLKRVYPDERNIASHINIAIKKFDGTSMETEPGITISKKSFEELVREMLKESKVIYMHKSGKPIEEVELAEDIAAIIGDHKGLPKAQEKFLRKLGVEKVSLGKIEYLSSQVITILHYELDRRSKW